MITCTDEIEVEAKTEKLDMVTEFVNEAVLRAGCPGKISMQIMLALEELFVNVASYAYAPGTGKCKIQLEIKKLENSEGMVSITILDSGKEFNPLRKENPDITLSADERQIGGLGIYMVKEIMDSVAYEYKNGQNHLTMVKHW